MAVLPCGSQLITGAWTLQGTILTLLITVIRLLVYSGAEVNLTRTDGLTPLLTACQRGHTNVARFLIDLGGDVNCKNYQPYIHHTSLPTLKSSVNQCQKLVVTMTRRS